MTTQHYWFSSFRLDLDRLTLVSATGAVALRPKSFEVLRCLVERAGTVVRKDELIAAAWTNRYVTDESLARCISDVRRALNDHKHTLVKTVAKRGYMLDAAVSRHDGGAKRLLAGSGTVLTALPGVTASDAREDRGAQEERKQVTALFVRVRRESAPQRDDLERHYELLGAVRALVAEAAEPLGAAFAPELDDGVCVFFGARVAQEDHASRGCLAALRVTELLRTSRQVISRIAHGRPSFGIGLAAGEAIVQHLGGDGSSSYRVVGRPVVVARELGTAAGEAAPLMSREVHVLVAGQFRTRQLRDREAFTELLGEEADSSRFRAMSARGLSKFVGREVEVAQLERCLAAAGRGKGRMVAIIGEAGLGKSRLLSGLVKSASEKGWLVLEGATISYRATTSYMPIIAMLRTYFGLSASNRPDVVRSCVTARMRVLGCDPQHDLAAVLGLLVAPSQDVGREQADPIRQREQTVAALKRLVAMEARTRPVLIAIEDLHWVDDESRAVIEALLDMAATLHLLVVVTYRPEFTHRWGSRSTYEQIRLDVLSEGNVQEFLGNRLGSDPSLSALKRTLSTIGNPLFLEEAIISLVELGKLSGMPGRYRYAGASVELQLPSSVQAMLTARIDRLSSRDKRLLQAASAIGTDVPIDILRRVSTLTEPEFAAGLTALKEAEFLNEAHVVPELEYAFKHALTHEATYRSLLFSQRRGLHQKIVEVMEEAYSHRLADYVEKLAHHAVQGEMDDKAVYYLRAAGQKAATKSALAEARAFYEQTIDLLDTLPETEETLRRQLEVRLELRPILALIGAIRELRKRLSEADARAERLSDDRLRCRVGVFVTNMLTYVKELEGALQTGDRSLALARSLRDVELRTLATTFLEQVHYHLGNYDKVVDLARSNLGSLSARQAREFYGNQAPAAVYDRFWSICSLAQLGRFDEAERIGREIIGLAEATDHAWTVGLAHSAVGILRLAACDADGARSILKRGTEVARMGGVILLLGNL